MGRKHIRLDDYFVYKDKQKYYLTSVDDISVWRGMSDEEKKKVKGEDVTKSVKRYIKKRSSVVLQPENEDYEPIELNGKSEAQIWGVVTSVIHDL